MAKVATTRASAAARRNGPVSYAPASTRPLHVLVFLLPLIVAYEIGSIVYLIDPTNNVMETIAARSILSGVFEAFGALSFHLPAILLVVILFLWHVLEKDPWRIKPKTIVAMGLESALWTLPLLVLGLLLLGSEPKAAMAVAQGADSIGGAVGGGIGSYPWQHRLTLSLGAGLYEELLFRLILISALHFVFGDVMKLPPLVAYAIPAVISAVAFAYYHANAGGTALPGAVFLFYSIAGVYFAALFVQRGFGVVVATHALYDIVVLLA